MTFQLLFDQFVIGVPLAASLFLIASGLTIVFGLLQLINFAHAPLYVLGAYFCFTVTAMTHNFWLGMGLSVVLTMVVGAVMEMGFLRRIYGREHILPLLLTYALILVITDATILGWGLSP